MKNKLNSFWRGLSPKNKRNLVLAGIIGAIAVTSFAGWTLKERKVPVVDTSQSGRKVISLDNHLLDKTSYMESKKEVDDLRSQFEALKKAQELQAANGSMPNSTNPGPSVPGGMTAPVLPTPLPPAPPVMNSFSGDLPVPPAPMKPVYEIIGDIESVTNPDYVAKTESTGDKDKKKEIQKVYLPSGSFVKANLLSGLDAPTVDGAKGHPVPALLRIKDIAVLPNKVKQNLKGCFALVEGNGSLASERAEMRLVSISCIAKDGQSVIDQKVKGFLVDGDGKIGLRGAVVAKFGATIARSMIAGFAKGFGQAIQSGTQNTQLTALGTTTMTPLSLQDAAISGAGAGIAGAADQIQKFYLKLAEQSMPVIEVGATRTVHIVFSEGTELEIKDACLGGIKCKK